jgi:hypothetical protein
LACLRDSASARWDYDVSDSGGRNRSPYLAASSRATHSRRVVGVHGNYVFHINRGDISLSGATILVNTATEDYLGFGPTIT